MSDTLTLTAHPRLYIGESELARVNDTADHPRLQNAAQTVADHAEQFVLSPEFEFNDHTHNSLLIRAHHADAHHDAAGALGADRRSTLSRCGGRTRAPDGSLAILVVDRAGAASKDPMRSTTCPMAKTARQSPSPTASCTPRSPMTKRRRFVTSPTAARCIRISSTRKADPGGSVGPIPTGTPSAPAARACWRWRCMKSLTARPRHCAAPKNRSSRSCTICARPTARGLKASATGTTACATPSCICSVMSAPRGRRIRWWNRMKPPRPCTFRWILFPTACRAALAMSTAGSRCRSISPWRSV